MKKLLIAIVVLALGQAVPVLAANSNPSPEAEAANAADTAPELFRAGEKQLDLFGAYGTGNVDYSTKTRTHTETYEETTHKHVSSGYHSPGEGPHYGQSSSYGVEETKEKKVVKKVTHYKDRVGNAFGGGVGFNYFITRILGVGVEGDWLAGDNCIHIFSGSVIARLPIENDAHTFGVAPYIYTGAGGQFDGISAGFWHIGGGVEARFCPFFGIFADGRYVLHDSDINYGLFRLGGRLIF